MKLFIGFSKPKNRIFPIFSWLIRYFEQTEYSHVYIRWFTKNSDLPISYEASGHGVNFICKEVFDNYIHPIKEYEIEINDSAYKKLITFCLENAGKNYGIKQIIGILLIKAFNLKKNPFANGKKAFVCSELVGTVLTEVINISISEDLETAGPKIIDVTIQNSGKAIRIL